MLFFASFPTPKPQQAEIVQVTAPPLSKIFTAPSTSKRLSASSASSIFSSLGFKPQQQQQRPTSSVLAIPRLSKCTHQSVTRFYTAASTSTPQDLKMEVHEYCQRCRRQHYFRWVYVCDNCSARACHNCRPKWADRAWSSFGSILGEEQQQQQQKQPAPKEEKREKKEKVVVVRGGADGKVERVNNIPELRRKSKRWSGGSWLRDKELT